MNPIEEKENLETPEEPKNTEEKENSKESSVKGDKPGEDILNLGEGNAESSSEGKNKPKETEENKEEENKEEENKEEENKEEGGEGGENKEDQNTEQQKETFKSLSGEEDNENKKEDIKNSQNLGSKVNEEKNREKTFENIKLIYTFQKNQMAKKDNFEQIYDKFWKLLPQTFEGEISKTSFISLASKILKILLPLFNHSQINRFCEGIWVKYTKGKNSMSKEIFNKVIFKITHLMSVNVNQYEYEDTLNLIYDRITCVRKYYANGDQKVFYPAIKVTLFNSLSKEEYQNGTWEVLESPNGVNLELFEHIF